MLQEKLLDLHDPYSRNTQTIYNVQKIYPDYSLIFKPDNPLSHSLDVFDPTPKTNLSLSGFEPEDSKTRSIRRTRRIISDLVICNKFQLFVTFTFKSDRQNIRRSKEKMQNYLKNTKKRDSPKLQYIIVPEFHKDKKAIHFHALINNLNPKHLIDSKKKINKRKAYNINNYRSGFSTAIKIDNHAKVSSYIRKYITKDMVQIPNQNRFWASNGLIRPIIKYNVDFENEPYALQTRTTNTSIYKSCDILQTQ